MIRRLIITLALVATPAAAQETAPPPAAVVVTFDQDTIRPLIVEGLANKETGRALEANDPVRIASISKLIMALTALRLVDEGKLDLDRDVSDYLGWKLRSPYHPDAPVTLAHLLSHRAGLSDAAGYSIPLGESLEAKFADPAAWRDVGPPGGRVKAREFDLPDPADFEYANLGSAAVATILEAASGERYDRLVERLIFAPLGVKACLNWVGCGLDMQARAVTLYRHTGEVAADGPARLPPACTIPVAEGQACDLESYVPGTNASIFSPQGGVRIGMMDLAKIGQSLMQADTSGLLKPATFDRLSSFSDGGETGAKEFFCHYGLGLQFIQMPESRCEDWLIDTEEPWIGHPGEAYGLLSGLWFNVSGKLGYAYFITEAPPPPGGEDTGNFTAAERALMARAQAMVGNQETRSP